MSDKNWKITFDSQKQVNKDPVINGNYHQNHSNEEEKKAFVPIFERAKVQFEILKVPIPEGAPQKKYFVNFRQKSGSTMYFYELVRIYLKQLEVF